MTLRRPLLRALPFTLSFSLIACATGSEDDSAIPPVDASPPVDATHVDAGHDTGVPDAGVPVDTGVPDDTGTGDDASMPPPDAGMEAGPVDAGVDAGHDSGVDAGFDAGVDAGTIDSGGVVVPMQGEVLISEVMYDPSTVEPDTEWFEVYNATSSPRLLSGLTIRDGAGRTAVIGPNVVLAGGAYKVMARLISAATGTAKVPASAILYEYGTGQSSSTGVILANGGTGAIYIDNGNVNICYAAYGTFTLGAPKGSSIEVKTLTYNAGNASSDWCVAGTAWASGSDKGTPGAQGDCP